jgi:2-hydroxy-6-oxonona-2,4-dienedioate hydrolase
MLRWIGFAGLGLLGIVIVVVAVLAVRFVSWRGEVERRLVQRSIVVQTAAGRVEYAEVGSGVPVLMLHGTPGGYDTILNLVEATDSMGQGLRVIAPSRPGYLRTPLESGATPEQQARLYAALLDKLGVAKVFVMGASGGGPSAMQFAMQYPERCAGLVLEAAVTHKIVVQQRSFPPLLQDFLLSVFRESAARDLQASDPTDPNLTKLGHGLFDSLIPSAPRAVGLANDLEQYSRIGDWDLGKIRCPTLIIQGTADTDVPPSHAEFAHAKIVNSELMTLDGVDHSIFFKKYKVLGDALHAFIAQHP